MVAATPLMLQSATSKIQATYSFLTLPTLHDLETLLTVVTEESSQYNLFKACPLSAQPRCCDC